ncbi:BURP domain-containing protein 6-like [Miscanthus floridulus]|uniref:BURP domain-containing protein 6-like n=1 Tax=Miscanthus floridulus TaxID=154761 RepID=UPI003459256C
MARSLAAFLLLLVGAVIASAVYDEEDSVGRAYFLVHDLYPGSKMMLHFTGAATGAPALPRTRAESIPFTSTKIPEILSRLNVPAGSPAAAAIRSTLKECEAPPLDGVVAQLCVSSFKAMADFAASCLRTRDVRAATMTKLSKDGATPRQVYVVESVRPMPVSGGDMVACHRMPYPYAVFLCHTTTATLYTVTLAGADGTKADAGTACHKDASPGISWPTFKKLGVAPGSVPVCHFLPQDSMLWMRN